jgi:DNA-binding beta-propeller fold protein YncE
MAASALVCTVLGAGEVIAAARIEPPGWAWSSSMLLNAIHYQQPATVLGALLATVALAGIAGAVTAWVMARGERARGAAFLLLAAASLAVGACREEAPGASGARLSPTAWFGSPGRGRAQFEYPRALDIDPRDGTVLVVDRQARVQRFSPDGRYLAEWRMPEKDLGKPTGLGIGPDGRVWVADTHYHRIVCWSPEGQELLRFGSYGEGPGQFIYPCDAEVGPDGNVWVCEFGGNDRVQVFRPDGTFVRGFGRHGRGPGEFDRPQSIAFASGGREVLVADACNHRVQVLDPDGRFLREIGRDSSPPVEFVFPYGIEPLADGTALVAEFGANRLRRIRLADGADLGSVRAVDGAPTPVLLHMVDGDRVRSVPSGQNALRFPWAVGVHGGDAFVLDSGHSRVLRVPVAALRTGAELPSSAASTLPAEPAVPAQPGAAPPAPPVG